MERKAYLALCKAAATSRRKPTVTWRGIQCVPIAYQLSYAASGEVRHTAVLLDGSNTTYQVPLQEVDG